MDVGLGGWIGTLVIGGLAGWVASKVMARDESMGVVANIVVGILGAVVANLLLPMFGVSGTSDSSGVVTKFIVAFVGALVLLFVWNMFSRKTAR